MDRLNKNPWERLQTETSRQFQAFCIYRDMGPSRSIQQVAQRRPGSGGFSKLKEWSITHQWVDRVTEYDDHMDTIRRAGKEEAILEMSFRHADYSMQILDKALDALNLIKPEDLKPHHLIRWLEVAVNIERLSRGASTQNIKQEEIMEVKKDVFTTEKLQQPEVRRAANKFIKAIANSQGSTDGVSTPSE